MSAHCPQFCWHHAISRDFIITKNFYQVVLTLGIEPMTLAYLAPLQLQKFKIGCMKCSCLKAHMICISHYSRFTKAFIRSCFPWELNPWPWCIYLVPLELQKFKVGLIKYSCIKADMIPICNDSVVTKAYIRLCFLWESSP